MPEWDIAGSFIQGIMARRQHDQQKEANEELIKKAKAENTLIELQAKAAQRKAALFEKYTGGGMPTFPGTATAPQNVQPQAMTAPSEVMAPTEVSGPQQVPSFTMPQQKQGIAQAIAQGQFNGGVAGQPAGAGLDPMLVKSLPELIQKAERAQMYEALGTKNPEIVKETMRGLEGPMGQGGSYSQMFNEYGEPIGNPKKEQPALQSVMKENPDLSKEVLFLERGNQNIVGRIQISPPGVLTQAGKAAFDDLVKDYSSDQTVTQFNKTKDVIPRLTRAKAVYDESGGKKAGVLDDALVVAISKVNDPDSAVMLGEFIKTKELQSWWDKWEGNLRKAQASGAGLTPEFRDELYNAIIAAMQDKANAYDTRVSSYWRERGREYNPKTDQIKAAFPLSSEIYTTKVTKGKPSLKMGGSKGKDYDREYIPGQGLK